MNKLFYILFSLGVITWLSSCCTTKVKHTAQLKVNNNGIEHTHYVQYTFPAKMICNVPYCDAAKRFNEKEKKKIYYPKRLKG